MQFDHSAISPLSFGEIGFELFVILGLDIPANMLSNEYIHGQGIHRDLKKKCLTIRKGDDFYFELPGVSKE